MCARITLAFLSVRVEKINDALAHHKVKRESNCRRGLLDDGAREIMRHREIQYYSRRDATNIR